VNLLAVDAAASVLSVAVSRGKEILRAQTDAGMKHSELVMNLIDELMKKAALDPADLEGVLCMGGPGSFTGLRIGYSIAKGLALSLSIPFAPVPTLECIAFARRDCGLIVPVIEARKNAFFYAVFRGAERLMPDTDAAAGEIAETIYKKTGENEKITLTGPGAAALFAVLPEKIKNALVLDGEKRGYAEELISIAKIKEIFHNDNTAFLYSGPEYIRKTDAELSLLENVGS
jgi:tRNA threonylcarbamoyladenosine biosynthesis protein TsaB